MSVHLCESDLCAKTCPACGREMITQHRGLLACPYCGFTLLIGGPGSEASADDKLLLDRRAMRGERSTPGLRGRREQH